MDAIDRIQRKIDALQDARQHLHSHYLLNQQPSNMAALADLDRMIFDLMGKQVRARQAAPLPSISLTEAASLQAAVRALQTALRQSAAVSQILFAATTLASLPGDDPTLPP